MTQENTYIPYIQYTIEYTQTERESETDHFIET